jgi:capsular polysaccharide biosynthesis protein
LGQDSVLGANQLTAQLVQLTPSDVVLAVPAAQLGLSTSALRGALSVGTVAQQNILQISTTAGSGADAQARANAVTRAVLAYVVDSSRLQQAAYARSVQGVINDMGRTLGRLSASQGKLTPAQLGVIQGEAGAIAGQDQALRGQLAQRVAASTPVVKEISAATSASKVSPRPVLYAIVAFLVVGVVAVQIVNAGAWRPRRR